MKTIITTIAFSLMTSLLSYGQVNFLYNKTSVLETNQIEENVLNADIVVKKINTKIYFNLKTTNDTADGFYVLEKYYNDDYFEKIAHKRIIPSNINKPLLYSLSETNLPDENVVYKIKRITTIKSETLYSYKFNNKANLLVEIIK